MQIQELKSYELFKAQDSIKYHSKATSDSVNTPLLLIKKELNSLFNYVQVKFSEKPLSWDSTQHYNIYDVVSYSNKIYQALEDNINSEPPNTSWQLLDTSSTSLSSLFLSKGSSDFIGLYSTGSESAMKIGSDKNSFIRTTSSGLLPSSDGTSSIGNSDNKFNGYFNNIEINSLNPSSSNAIDIGSSSKIFRTVFSNTIKCDILLPSSSTSSMGSSSNKFNKIYTNNLYGNIRSNSILPISTTANIGSSTNKFNKIYTNNLYGTSSSAKYADLAERYYADEIYTPGTVLGIGGLKEVTLYQPYMKLAGVVSTNPAFKMNNDTDENHTLMPFIALKGKIPVRTSVNITKGQYVLASDVKPGECYGVDTLTFEMSLRLIGVALEDYYVNDIVKTVNVKI